LFEQPGPHEQELRRHFGKRTIYFGGTQIAAPLFLLAFTNRCGSNLLAEYIRGLSYFAGFREELTHSRIIERCRQERLSSPAEYMLSLHSASPAQHYGFKANADQLAMVFRLGLSKLFSSTKVVHVRRHDALDQAVSFSIADQTKMWWSLNEPTNVQPKFIFDDIRARLEGIMQADAAIPVIAALGGADYFQLRYEDLVTHPLREIRHFSEFAGTAPPQNVAAPRISKQSTATNLQFRQQFIDCARQRMGIE